MVQSTLAPNRPWLESIAGNDDNVNVFPLPSLLFCRCGAYIAVNNPLLVAAVPAVSHLPLFAHRRPSRCSPSAERIPLPLWEHTQTRALRQSPGPPQITASASAPPWTSVFTLQAVSGRERRREVNGFHSAVCPNPHDNSVPGTPLASCQSLIMIMTHKHHHHTFIPIHPNSPAHHNFFPYAE